MISLSGNNKLLHLTATKPSSVTAEETHAVLKTSSTISRIEVTVKLLWFVMVPVLIYHSLVKEGWLMGGAAYIRLNIGTFNVGPPPCLSTT